MKLSEEDYLAHYGILRRSGRYPWGSGMTQTERNRDFLAYYDSLRSQGMSDVDIAKGLGYFNEDGKGVSTTALRAALSIAKNEQKAARVSQAVGLKERGFSNVAIGEKMGLNESSVRSLLKAHEDGKVNRLETTANLLRDECNNRGFIQVGSGVEQHLGVTSTMLNNSLAMLKEDGYWVDNVQVPQQGTSGKTTVKVLAPPGTQYKDVAANMSKIVMPGSQVRDDFNISVIQPPISISSKRLGVNYKEDGGDKLDGVIYVRPGVKDVSLGASRYAQVRIAIDGTHYIKGMAIYKDDLPPGVDLVFNTNKEKTSNKLDALKPMELENENPFGSTVRQLLEGSLGNEKVYSAMNIVNEEGNWETWSRQLSSQFLSKQDTRLASQQLGASFAMRKAEFDEIKALTNPTVRKKLMEDFSDAADSASVHLKAASLPKTMNHVLLPVKRWDGKSGLKDTEVFAPNYNNGERVVLIRHPHGGTFEIPELTVNNNNPAAAAVIGRKARDAIGINHKVAERLSGADFDGDHVLVIPNDRAGVKTSPALKDLEGFDPRSQYRAYEGMARMSKQSKQREMGDISNLITDMTIKGASHAELARAVKHSMVVIDAEKHNLNYKQSKIDNNISQLKTKYQRGPRSGASTLISQAKSRHYVPHRTGRPASEGGPIDKATGEKRWKYTDPALGKRPIRTTKLAEARNAHDLSSGTDIERVYADHSNRLKALANEARKEAVTTKHIEYSSQARLVYKDEVSRLDSALNLAKRNRPLERQAQILADHAVKQRRAANPHMDDDEVKKIRGQELTKARLRTGAQRNAIKFTDREWEAIQAGAVSKSKLEELLRNADPDRVRELATPRSKTLMTSPKMAKAKALMAAGHTQADIAQILGVSLTTLKTGLRG